MEVARVAALRGHKVTLYEKNDRLGGNLLPASTPGFKKDLGSFVDYLSLQIKKLGVSIELMKEATSELIAEMKPDEVIIATGAKAVILNCPGISEGISQGRVITAVDALLGKKSIGNEVIIVGGGEVGCETAVWLAQQGKKITVVEVLPNILNDMSFINRTMLLQMLDEAKVNVMTSTAICEATTEGVIVQRDDKQTALKADTIILSVGMKSETKLLDELEEEMPDVHAVGDCVEPRKTLGAIWEAYRIARLI